MSRIVLIPHGIKFLNQMKPNIYLKPLQHEKLKAKILKDLGLKNLSALKVKKNYILIVIYLKKENS